MLEYFVLVVFACGMNGFGSCVDSGVAVRDVAKFLNQATCEKAATQLRKRESVKYEPIYVRAECIKVGF